MGGSKSINNQFTFANDKIDEFSGFSHQHSATILPNGNLLLYDNGNLKPNRYSRAVEYSINESSRVVTKVWEYRSTPDIFMPSLGSVYRLPNGNTLINWGTEKITEVKPDKSIAFEMTYINANVYNAKKITAHAITESKNLVNPGNYNFNNATNETGVNIQVTNLSKAVNVHVQKHIYPPHFGKFTDSSFTSVLPYRWVFSNDAVVNLNGKFKINTKSVVGMDAPQKFTIYKRDKESVGDFYPLTTTYNSSSSEIVADFSGFGEFVIVSNVLNKPTLLSPAINEKVSLSGKLSWNLVIGAIKYQIQVDKTDKFTSPILNTIVAQNTSTNYSDLKPRTNYYWRVRAMNNKDTSAWSDLYVFKTMSQAPSLLYPLDNVAGILLADSLQWEVQLDSETYLVQVSKSNTFNENVINLTNHNKPSLPISNLDNLTKYYWRIAINVPNEPVEWSVTGSFTTTFKRPENRKPIDFLDNVAVSTTFEWISNFKVDNFNFELSYDKDFNNLAVIQSDISTNFFKISDLNHNTTYYWRVKSKIGVYYSDWSEPFRFKTILKTPKLFLPNNNSINLSKSTTLTWEIVAPMIDYRIQISTKQDFSTIFADNVIKDSDSYEMKALAVNTRYYWRIKAINGSDTSNWSSVWSFRTKLVEPTLLSPANGRTNFSLYSPLRWEKNQNNKLYSVQIATDGDFSNLMIDTTTTLAEFYIIKLMPQTKYYWRIKSFRDSLESDWSAIRTFTTDDGIGIQSPELLNPHDESEIYVDSYVVWEDVAEGVFYHLQVSDNKEFTSLVIDAQDLEDEGYKLHNLNYDAVYYWRIRVYSQIAHSEWSLPFSFYTIPESGLVQLVQPSDYELQVPNIVTFVWDNINEADYYELQLSENRKMTELTIDANQIDKNYYSSPVLSQNTQYWWRVRFHNGDEYSAWSPIWNFITKSNMQLAVPEIIQPLNKSQSTKIRTSFKWESAEGAEKYKFALSKNSKFTNIVVKYTDLTTTIVQCCKLDYNTNYYWRIAAKNDTASSPWSQTFTFLTELAPPLILHPLTGVVEVSSNLKLIWESEYQKALHQVQIALDPEFEYLVIDQMNISSTEYDCLLSPSTTYFVRLRTYNETNSSGWSNISSFTTSNTMSASESQIRTDAITISNYPNPFAGSTTFTYSNNEDGLATLKLFDIYGNQIATIFSAFFEGGTYKIKWNSGNLNSGVYYYSLVFGNNIKYGNLIIIN
jgi:hypothetical protein